MAANWEALSIQIPGQDILEEARKGMEALMVYLEVVKAILETVKVFLVDFGNPIKALAEAVLQLVVDLLEVLRRTGLYGWYDVPNPQKDPNFNRHLGGFPAFINRFKAGLYDPRDPNRPQPIPGGTKGGFVIIVADAEEPLALMRYIKVLMRFFGKEFVTPQYMAPADFKVLPVGSAGDPILAVTKIFQEQPSMVAVEWSLPPVTAPGDPGFSDLIEAASTNFIPPKFLIEKSEVNPAVGVVSVNQLSDASAAGTLVVSERTYFRDHGKGEYLIRNYKIFDEYGDPFVKFQQYIVIDATHATATFLLGQLGTFRYIDSEVEQNKQYYYRVRAFSGSLAVNGRTVSFGAPKTDPEDQVPYMEWPAQDPKDAPVMGRASPVSAIMIPTYPEKFDVVETLKRLFQTAFSLNFHQPMPEGAKFTSSGEAIEPTKNSDIGKQSLTSLAGALTSFEAVPLVGAVAGVTSVTATYARDPATGRLPEHPWNDTRVVYNAARLANIVAGAMLQANNAVGFKGYMEGPFPKGLPAVDGLTAVNIAQMVFQITEVQDPQAAGDKAVQDAGVLYSNVFADPTVRLNVLAAVDLCKGFTLIGDPPDWIQISVTRDIAPWSAQIIYQLLAKMQALVDAYSGVMAELRAFIDLLVQKIDTLERFLQHMISILDFVEGLSLGFYILNVPETEGGIGEWISLIDDAGGTPPPSGPGGYTGGVAIAYVAPDVTGFKAALDLIF